MGELFEFTPTKVDFLRRHRRNEIRSELFPMHQKSPDVLRRSDRILVGALTVVLAAVSAAVGAAAAYRPHADQIQPAVAAAAVVQQVQPAQPVQPVVPVSAEEYRTSTVIEQTVMKKLLKEHRCLSDALYYEARGEGEKGQKAIAEVIFTRLRKGNYGHSICAVVYEGANQPKCQFSFACNGAMRAPKQASAWMRAQQLAAEILTHEEQLKGATDGATNFHAISVDPNWAVELDRTTQIGNHIFYKNGQRARDM
jgi:spore germination cell wall hydrolase CwlJ-like protein